MSAVGSAFGSAVYTQPPPGPSLERKLFLKATFEDGVFHSASSTLDPPMYVWCLPENPVNVDDIVETGFSSEPYDNGAGNNGNFWDVRIIQSEVINGEQITPREGNYFMRGMLFYGKDTRALNNQDTSTPYFPGSTAFLADKPRWGANLLSSGQRFEFDEEVWWGFSVYVPLSWEDETGLQDHRAGPLIMGCNTTPAATYLSLVPWYTTAAGRTDWWMRTWSSDTSVLETGAGRPDFNLGAMEKGKWTDFVIRTRVNPFSVTTNPAEAGIPNAQNRTFEGNKGILQIWKSEGGQMVLKVDLVNTPTGLVPDARYNLGLSFAMYKYSWQRLATTVDGPIWMGFDSIRFGRTIKDGTGYNDVLPGTATPSTPNDDINSVNRNDVLAKIDFQTWDSDVVNPSWEEMSARTDSSHDGFRVRYVGAGYDWSHMPAEALNATHYEIVNGSHCLPGQPRAARFTVYPRGTQAQAVPGDPLVDYNSGPYFLKTTGRSRIDAYATDYVRTVLFAPDNPRYGINFGRWNGYYEEYWLGFCLWIPPDFQWDSSNLSFFEFGGANAPGVIALSHPTLSSLVWRLQLRNWNDMGGSNNLDWPITTADRITQAGRMHYFVFHFKGDPRVEGQSFMYGWHHMDGETPVLKWQIENARWGGRLDHPDSGGFLGVKAFSLYKSGMHVKDGAGNFTYTGPVDRPITLGYPWVCLGGDKSDFSSVHPLGYAQP